MRHSSRAYRKVFFVESSAQRLHIAGAPPSIRGQPLRYLIKYVETSSVKFSDHQQRVMGPSISTEIEVAAPPAAIWAVITDYERYLEWNPFLAKISGDKEGRSS